MRTLLRFVSLVFAAAALSWFAPPTVAQINVNTTNTMPATNLLAQRDFEIISLATTGTNTGNGASLNPVISSNGQFIAFVSDASNLVANDTNGLRDVFWRDRRSGTTRLVSHTPTGGSGNGDSDSPVISPDGRFVAFHSRASNLVANDSNTNYDVFIWDAQNDSVTLVSRTASGASGAGDSIAPHLSDNGRIVCPARRARASIA